MLWEPTTLCSHSSKKFSERGRNQFFDGIVAEENWSLNFTDGTSVMGTPVVFDEVAYFVTLRLDPDKHALWKMMRGACGALLHEL